MQNAPKSFKSYQELQEFLKRGQEIQKSAQIEEAGEIDALANLTANISNDSFVPTKNYYRVVFQQGVPVVDADLNEIGQIAEHVLSGIITDTIGSGAPTFSPTAYKIVGTGLANDFTITPGRLYVSHSPKGGAVPKGTQLTGAGSNYTTQPLPSNQGAATALPGLSTPTGNRTDTVWLDLYKQDYGPLDDPALYFVNPNTSSNLDVSHRKKNLAIIRVWENSGSYSALSSTGISAAPFYNALHTYYPLAELARTATSAINAGMVTDLRPRITASF